MMKFSRYPHVKDFLKYYASKLNRDDVAVIISEGMKDERDAEVLSKFIWQMLDQMSDDSNKNINVFGRTDNSDIIPDLEYEITLNIDEAGYREVWDRISDEENPE